MTKETADLIGALNKAMEYLMYDVRDLRVAGRRNAAQNVCDVIDRAQIAIDGAREASAGDDCWHPDGLTRDGVCLLCSDTGVIR